MRQFWKSTALVLGFTLAVAHASGAAGAESAAAQTAAALETLHAWVGDDANGQAWQRFLRSEELAAQVTLGDKADRATLAAIHELYASDTAGLDHWQFVEVREALAGWIARLPAMSREQLSAAALDAKSRFRAVSTADVQSARQSLEEAVAQLDEFLGRAIDEHEAGWRRYLLWEDLQEQLASDKEDLAKLQRVAAKFYRNENGLEMSQFTTVRDRLRHFMNLKALAGSANLEQIYQRQLDTLAPLLDTHAKAPSAETAVRIGQLIGWLDAAGQADPLVEAIRTHYCQPNFSAQISERLISAGVEEKVNETMSIADNILGTQIYGTATTEGQLAVDLLPNAERAEMLIQLTGTTYSSNVGYNRGVEIYSTGVTSVSGNKPIHLSIDGIATSPAYASCSTSSSINNIVAGSRLIERIAWRKANQSQGKAEYTASRRAEWRVAQRMDSQAEEVLVDARGRFDDEFRKPLMRRGEYPQAMRFRTTDRYLHLVMEQFNAAQLGSPSAPPEMSDSHDLSVRLHESMVRNFSRAMIGGVTLTDEKVAEMLEQRGREVPEELKITPDKQPWSITFTGNDPVSATFADGVVTFAVRARRFTSGDQEVRKTIEMSATYNLERTADGAKLTRDGDVKVEYVGSTGTLSSTQIALRTVLRKKFEALFQPEFVTDGLKLPGNWEDVGPLKLRQLHADQGWLALGWHLPGRDRTAALPQNAQP